MRFFLFVTFLFFNLDVSFSQTIEKYQPIHNYRASTSLIKEYKLKFANLDKRSTLKSGKAKDKFIEMAKKNADYFFSLDTARYIMYTDTLSLFLNTISSQIVSCNQELVKNKIVLFIERDESPNAYNLGEGVILVTLGLLERLRNVDELAFVICHEISHDILDHVIKGMEQKCIAMNDKALKKKIREVKSHTYNGNKEMEKLLLEYYSKQMNYSRSNELQADSLGYILYSKAGYRMGAGEEVMNILDSADYIRFTDTLNYRDVFNFSNYTFQNTWLESDRSGPQWERDSMLFKIADSLKTHPDCKERIKYINGYSPSKMTGTPLSQAQKDRYRSLITDFSFEGLQALMESEDYGTAFYTSLHMQKQFPNNTFLYCVTAHCLYMLADALSHNEYSRYVDFPDKEYSRGYNQTLSFLQNMNSATLKKLASCYFEKYLDKADDPYVGFLRVLAIQMNDPGKDHSAEIKKYETDYKDSYFVSVLKKLSIHLNPKNKKR